LKAKEGVEHAHLRAFLYDQVVKSIFGFFYRQEILEFDVSEAISELYFCKDRVQLQVIQRIE
jgi:hypothetical protein